MAGDNRERQFTSPLQEQQQESPDERPSKRQKVAAACDQCREKKIKCDGQKPICRPCVKRFGAHAVCDWGQRKTRSIGASKLEIIRLQSRIDELERRDNRRKSLPEGNDQTSPSTPMSGSTQNHHSGANAMIGLLKEEECAEEGGGVGDSSAASFMHRIKAVLDQRLTPASAQPSYASGGSSSSGPSALFRQRRFKNPDYVLPSRHLADKLLDTYWRIVDSLYPFIDKDDFMGKYQSLWTGNPTMDDEICFITLLNAMLAVACILDTTIRPSDRVSSGEVYYKRAQGYVDLEFLQFQSVHTVQCLLLMAQYLQSTREPQQCWMFVGLAIRIAQSLGLDMPSTRAATNTSGKSVDFLRKLWHGCVIMDRTLAMTFGRPTIITPQAAEWVPRPLAHPDHPNGACDNLHEPCTYNPDCPDQHFFLESLKLYEILTETLTGLYNPTPLVGIVAEDNHYTRYFGPQGAQAAGLILSMDAKYTTWQSHLPLHLRPSATSFSPTTHPIHTRQNLVLSFRHAHIRTLLFRPVLSRFCTACHTPTDDLDKSSLPYNLALNCAVMCVQSALHTVSTIGTLHAQHRLEGLDELLPAWWYCILFLYTSATVLVAARLNETIEKEVGGEEVLLEASRTAMEALNRYAGFGKHARRCAAAVELLFEQVPLKGQGQNQNQGLNHNHRQIQLQHHQQMPHHQEPSEAGTSSPALTSTPNVHHPAIPPSQPPFPLTAGANPSTLQTQTYIPPSQSLQVPDPSTLLDDVSGEYFDPSLADLRFGFDLEGDMSWLSSDPFVLYSEQMVV